MSHLEGETPEQIKDKEDAALRGIFKSYSLRVGYPEVVSTQIETQGTKRDFLIFGAFGEEEDTYQPEVLVIMSTDVQFRMVARAKWNEDWPQIEDSDAILGRVTVGGRVSEISDRSIGISEGNLTEHGVRQDDVLETLTKIALSLRFAGTNPHGIENNPS